MMKKEPEIWTDIVGYEGVYEVSNFGRIRILGRINKNKKSRIKKSRIDKGGYKITTLCKENVRKTYKIHRLVAIAFISNPHDLPQINHKDTDKCNNYYKNLEWCSSHHNTKHAIDNGLVNNSCENNNGTKLNNEIVKKIYKSIKYDGFTELQVMETFNIKKSIAMRMKHKRSWVKITDEVDKELNIKT